MMITSCHIDQDSSGKIHEANIGADGAGKRTVRGTWEITYRTIARLDAFPSPRKERSFGVFAASSPGDESPNNGIKKDTQQPDTNAEKKKKKQGSYDGEDR